MESESLLKPPVSKVLKSGRVILGKGEEVGEHVTHEREEVIVLLSGEAEIIEGDEKVTRLKEGGIHFIPEGVKHNVVNNGEGNLEYVYVVSLFGGLDENKS